MVCFSRDFWTRMVPSNGFQGWMVVAFSAILCIGPSRSATSAVVVSTFEEANLAAKLNSDRAFEGLTDTPSTFQSGVITFRNDGLQFGGTYWSGFGISQRTAVAGSTELYLNSNDLIAKPAGGAGGSQTWSVISGGGLMTAATGYVFDSLSITNTLYTWSSIVLGDQFTPIPMRKGGGTGRFLGQDDFFTARFTNTATSAFIDYKLADFTGAVGSVNEAWDILSVASLNASELRVSFLGSRETEIDLSPLPPQYFLDTPTYVAIDNIAVSAVPEPGSLTLLGLFAITGAGVKGLCRKRKSNAVPR